MIGNAFIKPLKNSRLHSQRIHEKIDVLPDQHLAIGETLDAGFEVGTKIWRSVGQGRTGRKFDNPKLGRRHSRAHPKESSALAARPPWLEIAAIGFEGSSLFRRSGRRQLPAAVQSLQGAGPIQAFLSAKHRPTPTEPSWRLARPASGAFQ